MESEPAGEADFLGLDGHFRRLWDGESQYPSFSSDVMGLAYLSVSNPVPKVLLSPRTFNDTTVSRKPSAILKIDKITVVTIQGSAGPRSQLDRFFRKRKNAACFSSSWRRKVSEDSRLDIMYLLKMSVTIEYGMLRANRGGT